MKCCHCGSTKQLVKVTQLHGLKLSFETGMTVERVGKTKVYCNECFTTKVWNTKKG